MDNQTEQQQAIETSNHIENPNSVLRFIRQSSSSSSTTAASNPAVQKSLCSATGSTSSTVGTTGRRPTYAQWISKAIASSLPKALTLADINEWMIRNVPGLQEQRYLHSCKGWKNAVRHTLSINRHRFKKVARDGKPSLWCLINEDDSLCSATTVVSGNDECVAPSPDNRRKMSPVVAVVKQQNERSSPENRKNDQADVKPFLKREDDAAMEGVEVVNAKVARMNNSEPQPLPQQQAANTQTLDVLYADGVLGKIILPMPLPISGLNFGGLLLNSATTAAVNPVQQQCHWPLNANNVNNSNLAFLQQMLKLSSSASPIINNNNTSILWDLFGMGDVMKNKSFMT